MWAIDRAIGERCHDGQRLDSRTAYRWVRSIGKQAGQHHVVIAARHTDPRTTTVYDRRRQSYDRHAAYAVVAFVTNG
jgi:hypothetical protein